MLHISPTVSCMAPVRRFSLLISSCKVSHNGFSSNTSCQKKKSDNNHNVLQYPRATSYRQFHYFALLKMCSREQGGKMREKLKNIVTKWQFLKI